LGNKLFGNERVTLKKLTKCNGKSSLCVIGDITDVKAKRFYLLLHSIALRSLFAFNH